MEVSLRDALLHLLAVNMPPAWYAYWQRVVDERLAAGRLNVPRP